jgi:hypothetical protein
MPQLVAVLVKRPSRRPIRVWIPVLPLALLCLPLVLLVVVAVAVASLVFRVDAVRALGAGRQVVAALRGAEFGYEEHGTAVLISIR